MAKKYTIYTGGSPYYLREPKTPEGLLKDYVNDPDLFVQDQADIKNTISDLKKESDEYLLNAVQLEKERDDLIKFLKNDLGFVNLATAQAFLKGEKLADIIGRLETIAKNAEDKWKVEAKDNQQLRGQLTIINQFLNKWAVNDLVELNLLLDGWKNYPTLINSVNSLINKESVADLNELDAKINQPITGLKAILQKNADDRTRYKQERDIERNKIIASKPAWEELVKRINKVKTVLFGDLTKKKTRLQLTVIATQMGWTTPDPNVDSGEEED